MTADRLTGLRGQVPAKMLEVYDALDVCYMDLSNAIMNQLPTDRSGEYLAPLHKSVSPFQQTRDIFRRIFRQSRTPVGVDLFLHCQEWPDVSDLVYPTRTDVTWVDPCDYNNHGIDDPKEAAAFCYVAHFMQVMLTELTMSAPLGPATKTQQHVWTHFTPFCGSNATTFALYTDDLEDATCTACYNRTLSADHFVVTLNTPGCLTKSPPFCDAHTTSVQAYQDAKKVWDEMDVCYVPWSNFFMESLPRLDRFLLPPRAPETPFTTTLRITREFVRKHGVRGCGHHEELTLV